MGLARRVIQLAASCAGRTRRAGDALFGALVQRGRRIGGLVLRPCREILRAADAVLRALRGLAARGFDAITHPARRLLCAIVHLASRLVRAVPRVLQRIAATA